MPTGNDCEIIAHGSSGSKGERTVVSQVSKLAGTEKKKTKFDIVAHVWLGYYYNPTVKGVIIITLIDEQYVNASLGCETKAGGVTLPPPKASILAPSFPIRNLFHISSNRIESLWANTPRANRLLSC